MRRTTRVVTGLGTAVLALALAACSSSGGASGTSTGGSSGGASGTAATTGSGTTAGGSTETPVADTSSATTTDYASLLIDASDIPVPGFEKGTPQDPPQGTGTAVAFTGAGGRTVGDSILILGSAAEAQAAAASAVTAAQGAVTTPEVTTAPIGDGGTAIRGTSAAGEVAVLVFSQGTAMVVLEFDSPAGDPVPTDVIQQVATAQSDRITSGSGG